MIEEQILYEKWLKGLQVGDTVAITEIVTNKKYQSMVVDTSGFDIVCEPFRGSVFDSDYLHFNKDDGYWTYNSMYQLGRISKMKLDQMLLVKKINRLVELLTNKSNKLVNLLSDKDIIRKLSSNNYETITYMLDDIIEFIEE